MERKVIQIEVERASEYNHTTLFALCEDGTVWMHEFMRHPDDWHWKRIKGIPEREGASAFGRSVEKLGMET
jgi:hypothetical protein